MRLTKRANSNTAKGSGYRHGGRSRRWLPALLLFTAALASGCATTYRGEPVGPTQLMQAPGEIPENQLLDVGILVFETDELTPKAAEEQGTTAEIRKAETHFMPYHLKQAFQSSSHWGAVRVIPDPSASADVRVKGKIIASNGKTLVLEVEVTDATGAVWFTKTYKAEAGQPSYSGLQQGKLDAFQDLYNRIVNDTVAYKLKMPPARAETIRTVSRLAFAEGMAPTAFTGYLDRDAKGRATVNRLPAPDDPMMDRLLKVRDREYMYVDTLNEQYDVFYNTMWPSYENWRSLNLTEQEAIQKVKRDALVRQIAGALLMVGAVALAASDTGNTGAIEAGLIIVGGQVIIDGFNISRQAQIHSDVIKELSESFEGEMKPVVMEFEGKQYELTGPAKEQFEKWRLLLHQIWAAETGFDPEAAIPPADNAPAGRLPFQGSD